MSSRKCGQQAVLQTLSCLRRVSARIDDEAALEAAVRDVMAANAGAVTQYRAGKQQTFGFLVGQVMKATKGKANPALVNSLMKRLLDQA